VNRADVPAHRTPRVRTFAEPLSQPAGNGTF
jgi:hypothetical protein